MKQKKTTPKKTKTSSSTESNLLDKLEERFKHYVGVIEKKFDHYLGVIREDFNSKFQLIREIHSTTATKEDLRRVEDEVKEVKFKVQIIETGLHQKADKKDLERLEAKMEGLATDIKSVLSDYEQRIVSLERK